MFAIYWCRARAGAGTRTGARTGAGAGLFVLSRRRGTWARFGTGFWARLGARGGSSSALASPHFLFWCTTDRSGATPGTVATPGTTLRTGVAARTGAALALTVGKGRRGFMSHGITQSNICPTANWGQKFIKVADCSFNNPVKKNGLKNLTSCDPQRFSAYVH